MTISRRDCANAIRFLAMDAVQKAQSGHPGMPMGMADIAEVLWRDYMRYSPDNPAWINRDRFILSNGHGAMLHYALLHLTGYALSIDDLKQFRQLHSRTPGHPEYRETPGVETTTGPLGQGLANGVGMAIAETMLAAQFNRAQYPIIDHYTYVFAGDGCLMEGISHEVCALAGTLGLGKLIVFWDDNGISIDGDVRGWFTDDTAQRFESYGWQVIRAVDGHNADSIHAAIAAAQACKDQPSLICCKTMIGYGAPRLGGTADCHGSALGEAEIALARAHLEWSHAPFSIPEALYAAWDARPRGGALERAWNNMFKNYYAAHPVVAEALSRRLHARLPASWAKDSAQFIAAQQKNAACIATRKASLQAIEVFAKILPELIGGSADLSVSNCTQWTAAVPYHKQQRDGNYIYYGVREFGMSAIMNGMALYGACIPFGGTFLVFSDYARNAIRLAALMKQRVIFVYTHDSIGVGEDGPTHQPIEHIASLRLIPGLSVWRPCDVVETAVAWQQAIAQHGPSSLLLTRQNVVCQKRDTEQVSHIARGAYVLLDAELDHMAGILIATGSEVALAMDVAQALRAEGEQWRVVSMPCVEVFQAQTASYRESVLPPSVVRRVAIEAGVTAGWHQWVGSAGTVIGMDCFGASARAEDLFVAYGLTVEQVLAKIKK